MYSFDSDGGLTREFSVKTEDPNVFLFRGVKIQRADDSRIDHAHPRNFCGRKMRWQTKIKKISDAKIVITFFHWRKAAFQPWSECHYVRA
jgi:hypothetical protein